MGCCHSRLDREEIVSRCKARRRYMKELVKARQAFSVAHNMYLQSLRGTGSALLQFATAETNLHHHLQNRPSALLPSPPLPPPTPPPTPPPPISPSFDYLTSVTASPAQTPPPPPPPSSWDFWDPFAPSSSKLLTEEEWETIAVTTASEVGTTVAASVAAPPSVVSTYSKESTSEVVVSTNIKDLVEIIKELDEYFLKAADAGTHVSRLLEVSNFGLRTQKTTGE